jgi:Rps23 Pro-64 3,4-dihydroxylase Tpa1-like proline 4-hydroxylase
MATKKIKPLNPVDTTVKVWKYESVQCTHFEKLDEQAKEQIKKSSTELIEQLKEMGVLPPESETKYEEMAVAEIQEYDSAKDMAFSLLMSDLESKSFIEGIKDATGKKTLKTTMMSIVELSDGSCFYYAGQTNLPYNSIIN